MTIPALKQTKQDKHEARRRRFWSVAKRRTGNVLKQITLLEKCANRQSYAYEQEEVDQMMEAIQDRVTALQEAFAPKTNGTPEFDWNQK